MQQGKFYISVPPDVCQIYKLVRILVDFVSAMTLSRVEVDVMVSADVVDTTNTLLG